jgi:hypothetical protein
MMSQNYKPKTLDDKADADWPKWVEIHPSQIVRKESGDAPASVSVAGFEHFFDRVTGAVKVLVHNAEDEARALAEKVEAKVEEPAAENNGDDGKAA